MIFFREQSIPPANSREIPKVLGSSAGIIDLLLFHVKQCLSISESAIRLLYPLNFSLYRFRIYSSIFLLSNNKFSYILLKCGKQVDGYNF